VPGGHRRRRLGDQPALADPGRSDHVQQPRLAACDHLVDEVEQHAQLGVPTYHRTLEPRLVARRAARQANEAAGA